MIQTLPAERLDAERPKNVRALDFTFDQIAVGRSSTWVKVDDESTPEAWATGCHRRSDADHTASVLGAQSPSAGGTGFIRSDNGPELTTNALRDR